LETHPALLTQFGVVRGFLRSATRLVLALTAQSLVVDRENATGQVEHMAPLTFLDQGCLCAKHPGRQLIVEKILKFAQAKRGLCLQDSDVKLPIRQMV